MTEDVGRDDATARRKASDKLKGKRLKPDDARVLAVTLRLGVSRPIDIAERYGMAGPTVLGRRDAIGVRDTLAARLFTAVGELMAKEPDAEPDNLTVDELVEQAAQVGIIIGRRHQSALLFAETIGADLVADLARIRAEHDAALAAVAAASAPLAGETVDQAAERSARAERAALLQLTVALAPHVETLGKLMEALVDLDDLEAMLTGTAPKVATPQPKILEHVGGTSFRPGGPAIATPPAPLAALPPPATITDAPATAPNDDLEWAVDSLRMAPAKPQREMHLLEAVDALARVRPAESDQITLPL